MVCLWDFFWEIVCVFEVVIMCEMMLANEVLRVGVESWYWGGHGEGV